MSNYDNSPYIKINGYDNDAYSGYAQIDKKIKESLGNKKIVVVDCYLGINDRELLNVLIKKLTPAHVILSEDIFYDGKKLTEMMQVNLTEDRVRGVMYYGTIRDYVDEAKLAKIQKFVKNKEGIVLVYGFGASLITKGDLLIYADLTRWEIQLRYRAGLPNFKQSNYDEDPLIKNKRGYFIEWRIADKHKREIFEDIDLYLDTNCSNKPKMITGIAFRNALRSVCNQPFRLVPYFDPGVWGGQWMKEVCNLDKSKSNYAWSFDGVPEENSLYFRFGDTRIEIPAMDLVLYQPVELLGMKNYCRFGAEFPIRFDFLDTIDGENLSLQVHPLTEYIKSHFGMTYTQDESYYILDCKDDGGVYLGLKEGIDKNQMLTDLKRAQEGHISFNAEKYINKFHAKKHDHFLIPAGTCHCSGNNAMVLEISATPYIFTFKLWDWERLGLDGKPRPVHVEHGKEVIQWYRTTPWVKENLVNAVYEVKEEANDCKVEHTGLHALEFIETRRYTTDHITNHDTQGTVHVLNLIDGKEAIVESPDHAFEPFVVHYAETFIIPAQVGSYTIRPYGESENEEIKLIKAYVR